MYIYWWADRQTQSFACFQKIYDHSHQFDLFFDFTVKMAGTATVINSYHQKYPMALLARYPPSSVFVPIHHDNRLLHDRRRRCRLLLTESIDSIQPTDRYPTLKSIYGYYYTAERTEDMAQDHFRLKNNTNTPPNVRSNNNQNRHGQQKQEQQQQRRPRRRRRDRGPVNPKLWLKSSWEIITTSLFFSPVLAVIVAILLGFLCSVVDTTLSQQQRLEGGGGGDSPGFVIWTTNVSSAQTLLSTVAGATISFAGTAFSVSLLVIQLASTQYSPRVVHTLFKDPFNRRIVSLVVGTFTYCLVGLRSLGHTSSQQQEETTSQEDNNIITGVAATEFRPDVTVVVAFLLGIASVLAIVAFIDHAANTMDISQLLERITRDTILQIQRTWVLEKDDDEEEEEEEGDVGDVNRGGDCFDEEKDIKDRSKSKSLSSSSNNNDEMEDGDPAGSSTRDREENPKKPKSNKGEEAEAESSVESHVVRFRSSGWVQEIDIDLLLSLVPEQSSIKVHTMEGR